MNSWNQPQASMQGLFETSNRSEGGHKGPARPLQAAALEAFSFGPFRLVPSARLLERDGSPASLGSRAFDLLCLLVRRPGEVVSKSELMAGTWPNMNVEESSLRFHIAQLRRTLGDSHGGERYVVNVPGRGYCFVAYVGPASSRSERGYEHVTPSAIISVQNERQLAAI